MKINTLKKMAYLFAKLASMSRREAANILGIREDATEEEIKKSYKKMALKAHPDQGGSTQEMIELNIAREIMLKDIMTGGEFVSPKSDFSDFWAPIWSTKPFNKSDPFYNAYHQPQQDAFKTKTYTSPREEFIDDIISQIEDEWEQLEWNVDHYGLNKKQKLLLRYLANAVTTKEIFEILKDLKLPTRPFKIEDKYKEIFTKEQIKEIIQDIIDDKVNNLIELAQRSKWWKDK